MAEHEGVIDAIFETLRGNFVNKEVKLNRLAICGDCEYLEPEFRLTCMDCNCLIDWKTSLEKHSCPKKKW